MIRSRSQEQNRDITRSDIRQISIKSSTDAQIVSGKIQLARDGELAIRAELNDDFAIECLLRRVDREELGSTRDRHGFAKGVREPRHVGVGLQGNPLSRDLITNLIEPLKCGQIRRQSERCTGKLEWIGIVGQAREEVDTSGRNH